MKKFLSILAAAAIVLTALCMSAAAAEPIGRFMFNDASKVDPTKWTGQAASVLSYNEAEKALQVSRQANDSKANGINNDVENGNFTDIGYQPVPIGPDGYNFMKIKLKAVNGFAPEKLLMHLSDAVPKKWIIGGYEVGTLDGIGDGEWHEYIFDISAATADPLLLERMMVYVTGMDETKDQALLYKYICFFKTEAEAKAFTDAPAAAAPASAKPVSAPVTADPGAISAAAVLLSGAAFVCFKKRK